MILWALAAVLAGRLQAAEAQVVKAELVEVEVDTTDAASLLAGAGSRRIFVTVTNKAEVPIQVKVRCASAPVFLQVAPAKRRAEQPVTIAPGFSWGHSFRVKSEERVEPGTSSLLWRVDLTWKEGGIEHTGSVFQVSQLKLGVVGEELLSKVVGVPSLLLLPGALCLWLYRAVRHPRKTGEEQSKLEITSIDFWAKSGGLSLIFVPLFKNLPFGWARSETYLTRFSLSDITFVWWSALTVGALVGLTARFSLDYLPGKVYYPEEGDSPWLTVFKLGMRGKGLQLRWVKGKVSQPGSEIVVSGLELHRVGETEVWLAPEARIEWYDREPTKFRAVFDTRRARDGGGLNLVRLGLRMWAGQRLGYLDANWRPVQGSPLSRGPRKCGLLEEVGRPRTRILVPA